MNIVVVLSRFGTLKVQSFILIEVSHSGLLIVVTSSTFLKRKDMFKEKAVSPDYRNLHPSIHIDKCNLYTYKVYMLSIRILLKPTPGLTSSTQVVCACVRAYTNTRTPTTLTPARIEKYTRPYLYPC